MMEYSASLAEDIYEAELDEEQLPAELETAVQVTIIRGEHYHGAYSVTPGREAQVLETAGLVLDQPVVIGAIPREYGLITYDGRGIRVS